MKGKILTQSILILLTITFISSCNFVNDLKAHLNREKGVETRIVDVNGKYKPVKLYRPILNVAALEEQGKIKEQKPQIQATPIKQQEKATVNNNVEKSPTPSQLTNANPTIANSNSNYNVIPTTKSVEERQVKKEAKIEYDLSDTTPTQPILEKKKPIIAKSKKSTTKSVTKSTFIQVGSYRSLANAKTALFKNKKIYKGKIEKITMGNRKLYRVLLGPVNNKKEANNLIKKVAASGYKDAFIIKK